MRTAAGSSATGSASRPWRAASWLATLLAGTALALVLAHWGWRVFGPVAPPVPSPPLPERWAPAITSAPIFGRVAAPGAVAKVSTLQGEARLIGVFAERDGSGYALFRLPDRGPVLVRSGQEVSKDVMLEAVRGDGVRLRDRGEVRDIVLRAAMVQAAPTAPSDRGRQSTARAACTAPAGYQGPVYRINAELLTGIASQPDSWKALVVAGKGGLTMRDDTGFATMLGMRAGDRMAQANGIALSAADDVVVAVVKPLLASQPVRVAGTRDGKPAEWLFVNAGACPG
jgi:hypothetical protein